MADEIVINGIGRESEDNTVDGEHGSEFRVVELSQKVKSLELEKAELVRGNDEEKERNHKLTIEIERLKGEGKDMRAKIEEMSMELELVEEGRRVLDSITKRAVDLETEVSRLQHDLISAMNEVEEVNKGTIKLRSVVEEKEKKIGGLEIEVEALKKGKVESEMRVRELERKAGVSAARESEWESEKVRLETELREKLEEKEGLVRVYEKKVETLDAELRKSRVELEKVKKDKIVVEDAMKESEEKAKKLEKEMIELQRDLAVAETIVSGLKEKAGVAAEGKCLVGLKEHWHLVAVGSAGAVAAGAAMAHVYFSKRQS